MDALDGVWWSGWVRVKGWGLLVQWVDRGVFVAPFSERYGFRRAVYVGPIRLQVLRPLGV